MKKRLFVVLSLFTHLSIAQSVNIPSMGIYVDGDNVSVGDLSVNGTHGVVNTSNLRINSQDGQVSGAMHGIDDDFEKGLERDINMGINVDMRDEIEDENDSDNEREYIESKIISIENTIDHHRAQIKFLEDEKRDLKEELESMK